jgi:hypothetical protein
MLLGSVWVPETRPSRIFNGFQAPSLIQFDRLG